MKKRFLSIALCFYLLFNLNGCFTFYYMGFDLTNGHIDYNLKYDKNEVEAIQIVYVENNQYSVVKDVFSIVSIEKQQEITDLVYSYLTLVHETDDIGDLNPNIPRKNFLPGYSVLIIYNNNEGEIVSPTGTYNVIFQNNQNTIIEQAYNYYIRNVYHLMREILQYC